MIAPRHITPHESDPSQLTLGQIIEPGVHETGGREVPDIQERLLAVWANYGFIPATRGEANDAFVLMGFAGSSGTTARHLNEILLHQQKADTDTPANAIRSVVTEYGNYAKKARNDHTQLTHLAEELEDTSDASNFTSLKTLDIQSGKGQFVRYLDLLNFVRGNELPVVPLLPTGKGRGARDPYTIAEPDTQFEHRIDEVLADIRVYQARHIVGIAIDDQVNRRRFWTSRLKESRAHMTAKPIASTILKNLGVEPE